MTRELKEALLVEIKQRYDLLSPYLSERTRRIWAAAEATVIGRGGISLVCEATGISRVTLTRGQQELHDHGPEDNTRIRQPGGGRKKRSEQDPRLLEDLDKLIDPYTRGDPQSPLRWTCKSTYKLSQALQAQGHQVSQRTVYDLLQDLGYSLQANRKTQEGRQHPDRDEQFQHINQLVTQFQRDHQPVISVDAKKKENIGNFKNPGREWEKKGQPRLVKLYDFPEPAKGKACPYGVFDMSRNEGWINVGISHDTAEFALESMRRWWKRMGQERYPRATRLLIIVDSGGSNGYRPKLWKRELQQFSNETQLVIHMSHLPPGTSKWNKIEHQMFSFVSKNWRGRPLDSLATIVNLISNTTTTGGLHIEADIDTHQYQKGIAVSDEEMDSLNIKTDTFHGKWNYKIFPQGTLTE